MRKISAKIVADSINPQGNRITTMLLIYPRFIHGELLTHRMFSKNSASSRAIPFKKMKEMVMNDPFIPLAWQKDHSGMQGTEYITDKKHINLAVGTWLMARNDSVKRASELNSGMVKSLPNGDFEMCSEIGVTKQLCNRLLEPFMWHKVLLTATEFENFFNLRCPQYEDPEGNLFKSKKEYHNKSDWEGSKLWRKEDWYGCNKSQAEIHIQALAESMYDAMNESTPVKLKAGEYHMPYGNNIDLDNIESLEDLESTLLKVCTARCARLSYQTVGNNPKIDYEADIRLHDMLLKHHHMSPFEHCQRAMTDKEYQVFRKVKLINLGKTGVEHGWCDNMKGFISYRYLLENNLKL